MVGKEDAPAGGEGSGGDEGGLQGPCEIVGGRKLFWRSASWSSSRTMLPPLNPYGEKDAIDHQNGNGNGQCRRVSGPLTPRSQNSFKNRSCLPPLQPLSIARRSLDEWPKAGSDDIGEWPLPSTPSGRDVINGGERLKLDLSNIQRNSDKSGGLVKRDKIAFFDKKCSKVADHVYLGGDAVARDRDILKQHGITHILNCVGFVCPEYFKADFVYRTLWLQDSPTEDITSILYDVFDYFEDVREQGGRVFVHCCQGVSRSTSLVIAYLMWREGQSFDDAFQYVKAARGIADPNMGFACQLLQCQKRVHAFPLSPSSLLRMYRIAPHSPYDPLHLVPKMLNDPSPSALDSRGAFIIHIPSAIYVWIGKKCEIIMERDARGAVCQIVRYEKVQGPVVMIKEGEEPSYFWDAFSSLLPLMDKSGSREDVVESSIKICSGDRKIDSYSVDFEIFQKAIMGGFVPPFASSETEQETHLPVRESSWSVLRRKFVSGNMKDFVSTTKSGPSVVYPDSSFIVAEQCGTKQSDSFASSLLSSVSSSSSLSPSSSSLSSLSSSSSSSSSSPPYLSPDSFSDASFNSTSLSDSPVMSPLASSCSGLTSSILCNFSDMTLMSSKISPQSISKSSKFIDVNFSSKSCLRSVSTPSKKFPLSIAERRGSSSKCLKLQMLSDDSKGGDIPANCLVNEQDLVESNNLIYSVRKSDETDVTENLLHSKEQKVMDDELKLQLSLGSIDSCNEQAALRDNTDLPRENHHFGETPFLNGIVENGLASSAFVEPMVYRWPSLEKVVTFGYDELDSQSAFIVIAPSPYPGKTGAGILYFWVGRLFSCNKCKNGLEHYQNFGDLVEVDWKQASSDVVSRMGLPKDIKIEIIKENEEPAEFLSFLSSLWH